MFYQSFVRSTLVGAILIATVFDSTGADAGINQPINDRSFVPTHSNHELQPSVIPSSTERDYAGGMTRMTGNQPSNELSISRQEVIKIPTLIEPAMAKRMHDQHKRTFSSNIGGFWGSTNNAADGLSSCRALGAVGFGMTVVLIGVRGLF